MAHSATEDRLMMLQIYCERRGLAIVNETDFTEGALRKIALICGELVCELDMMKAGLKLAGRERK